MEFTSSNQLKSFMKKESSRLGISIPNVYHTYIARKALERISIANNPKLLVKGSSAETAYLGSLVRGITDIDLAGLRDFNINKDFLVNILLNNKDSYLTFKLNKKPYRTPTGIEKISCSGTFHMSKKESDGLILDDSVTQDLSIDVQDKYNRLIEPQKRIMPAIFEGDEPFEIWVPSFEEYLAEKLCIIVESNKKDVLNTRLKDFYDIYQLHGGKYDYDKLTHYFGLMLTLRNKIDPSLASTFHLDQTFIRDHKKLWEGTSTKYDFIDKEIDLEGAVYYTRGVLREQLQKQGIKMPNNHNLVHTIKRV